MRTPARATRGLLTVADVAAKLGGVTPRQARRRLHQLEDTRRRAREATFGTSFDPRSEAFEDQSLFVPRNGKRGSTLLVREAVLEDLMEGTRMKPHEPRIRSLIAGFEERMEELEADNKKLKRDLLTTKKLFQRALSALKEVRDLAKAGHPLTWPSESAERTRAR